MKGYIKTIALFLVLVMLLPATVLAAEAALPSYYQESYYAELSSLYQNLKDVKGPKIVVVGGSNVAFGLNAELLEQTLREKGFDYTVCPFGLYAAVGTSAMLDLSRDALNEGDIVVLAMEPTSETMSSYFGATAFWKCAEDDPEMFWGVSRDKQNALLGNYIPYLQERYEIHTSGMVPVVEGVYAKASFNERGDMIFERLGNTMALGYDTAAPVDLGAVQISPDFAKQVNDYCAAAQKAGAQVCFSFSPVNRAALVSTDEADVQAFFQHCNTTFDCPVISDPNAYILDSGWFYDTNFHLNSDGALLRTYLLAEDLLVWLGCYEKLVYDLPPMPDFIAQTQQSTASTADFTYEPIHDQQGEILGYRISGLTDTGLQAQELTVPSVYADRPVVGFTADALAGATALQALQIPESIETLPDGLFRECPAMDRLILEHRDRLCTVTSHTFDGADQIKIFVPSKSYAMYRDGDGCETNPWTQYLQRIYPYG
ncbi:MAG: hypothetical protein J6V34_04025 [Oscillospiraceae bacterium]|nr:hypothetical protein [Oscillospiraceae bacterium]